MNCPYCGKPLEPGKIPGYDRTVGSYWYPEEASIPWAVSQRAAEKRDGILLNEPEFPKIPCIKASVCRSCKKGFFDLP